MDKNIEKVIYVLFVITVLFFGYTLYNQYFNTKVVKFNDKPEVKVIDGRESIEESLSPIEEVSESSESSDDNNLDKYFKEASPLQKYSGVKDEKPMYDYENRYLVTDSPKDTMKGVSTKWADNQSGYLTVPDGDENNFNDAYGKPVEDTNRTQVSDFQGDMELKYDQWFQGKEPRILIPDDSITHPKFEKELENKQDYTAIGEWQYKNETNMNTGSTGNDISGYSSFHSGSGLVNNKLEVSECHS